MDATYLRALQAAIMADAECAALAVTPENGKVPGGAYAQDKAIADILRRQRWFGPGQPASHSIGAAEARNILLTHGLWRPIVRKAAEDGTTPLHDACWDAVELAKSDSARIDAYLPRVALLLDLLMSEGMCTAEARAELEAACANDPPVSAADVSRALRGPWGDET